LLRSESMSCN